MESQNEVISTTFILLLYAVYNLSIMHKRLVSVEDGTAYTFPVGMSGVRQNDVFDHTTSLI